MTDKQQLYALVFEAEPQPVVFYIGRTNNPERRLAEHRSAAKNLANTEYKYQWCRNLEAVGIEWDLIVIDEIITDEDSEYAWVLKFARDNEQRNISFIDDLPLTNMKAGDFITEMIRMPSIQTAADIRSYRNLKAVQAISYERDGGGTGEHTDTAKLHIEHAHQIALAQAVEENNRKLNKITRTTNTMSEEDVRKANSLLLKRELLEGSMLWAEYNREMQRIGYPAWTETRPQIIK